MATWHMYSFQDPNSTVSAMLIFLHDFNMMILISIMVLITYFFIYFSISKFTNRIFLHGQFMEIIWTLVPMLGLGYMAIPSLQALYYTENDNNYFHTFKTIGHQWYWTYEYPVLDSVLSLDSFMIQTSDLELNGFRLLEVDNRIVVPVGVPLRNLITSSDVIHSWALPSLGMKVDAVPGRLNQISIYGMRSGVYFGQCSEICGMNHSFMPIVMEMTDRDSYMEWILKL